MNIEKKQLLLISNNAKFVTEIKEGLSLHFEINVVNGIHSGYHTALGLLPDIILLDHPSLDSKSFKNLANFKSTHFLNKCWLIMYAEESSRRTVEKSYSGITDEIFYSSTEPSLLAGKIIKRVYSNFSLTNYWKDSFMGLFNLLANPVVLLEQDNIIQMNDAFKQTFKVESTDGIKLTDFVKCENKAKVKESLRNFARGKHMKAVTRTVLRLKNDKVRNAKISFSKLDKMINGQYIMMIHFSEEVELVTENIGTNSSIVENCFEDNARIADFSFTKREKEIIQLLCKGYKTKEISETLFISPKTIEKHRANIIKRTNSETILESIIYAISHNLIDLQVA
ncbi:LuxR C-terminal-related transcriptional regulator [Antarcticibacterium sp. 1MA-6-2]|uniref:response regulator transcription factor n=1 Tax=Antarcticibacterium sp. 1MA-6-2 TaxID=2908210 RepID=UPI001F2ED43E|nr:LuxR C-terminal-related transcriptional regulator [Antarcticibacterium sp. 1MA-6-2]UJH91265.1 LuxR C-terminal-related transcriptional regulator [Antarcticibacterium sp. 1MA-6-2]